MGGITGHGKEEIGARGRDHQRRRPRGDRRVTEAKKERAEQYPREEMRKSRPKGQEKKA